MEAEFERTNSADFRCMCVSVCVFVCVCVSGCVTKAHKNLKAIIETIISNSWKYLQQASSGFVVNKSSNLNSRRSDRNCCRKTPPHVDACACGAIIRSQCIS